MSEPSNPSIWSIMWGGVVTVLNGLGLIVMSQWRVNRNTVVNRIDGLQTRIEVLAQQKADKEDVDKKHQENIKHFDELKDANLRADEKRDLMLNTLTALSGNVQMLLDRSKGRR